MKVSRRYESRLREEQAAGTRERILEALAEQLADAREEFSIPRVAERAGVSVRTVYSHLPNREAQIDALAAWLDQRLHADESGPADADDLPAYAERMYLGFLAHQALSRAQLAPGIAASVRARRRRRRDEAIARAVAGVVADGPTAREVTALLKLLIGADSGVALLDRHGVAPERLAPLVAWATRVIVAALRRKDRPGPEIGGTS